MAIDSATGVRRTFLLSFVVDFKLCLLSILNTPKSQQVWTKICESQITNISLPVPFYGMQLLCLDPKHCD
jgi:hypothetical protein